MSTTPPSPHSGREPSAGRPELEDPWLRAARRRELPVLVGIVAFGALLVALGIDRLPVVVLGAWIIGVGALLLAARAVRDKQERGDGPRGSISRGEIRGELATVLREHPARGLLTAGLTAYPGVLLLVAALMISESEGSTAVVVVGVIAGAAFLLAGVRHAIGVRRTGVWLRPTGLSVQERTMSYDVTWPDVGAVSTPAGPTDLVVVVARGSSAVTVRGRERRGFPRGPRSEVTVRTEASALDAPGLARVLAHYAGSTDASELGSPAGADAVRAIVAR